MYGDQIDRQRGQAFILIISEAIFDCDVLSLDKACGFQSFAKRSQQLRGIVGRFTAEKSNDRHHRLLCAHAKRPSGCRASNNFDEISSAHVLPPGAKTTPFTVVG
jgi:hypothetical protein